jgi:hypothetical protein
VNEGCPFEKLDFLKGVTLIKIRNIPTIKSFNAFSKEVAIVTIICIENKSIFIGQKG